MSRKKETISDKKALSNLETLLKIPLIKRFGIVGVSKIMSNRAVKFKPDVNHIYTVESFGSVKCDVITKRNTQRRKVVLYFHLGAFVSGTTDTHREVGELFLKNSSADTVIIVNYRTSPEYRYPCAHDDAFEVFNEIINRPEYSQSKIFAAGDSSGGNLALSLALKARDIGIRTPDALILISPWVDFTNKGPSYTTNFNSDPMFGYLCTDKDRELITLYSQYADKTDIYLSPVYAESFIGMPRMFIVASDNEMLLDDAVEIKNLADKSGVCAELKLYNNMFHSFLTVTANAETSKIAWRDIGDFINNNCRNEE